MRFAKFLRTPILKNICKRLLLETGKHKEASVPRCSSKYAFLKISQYLQENIHVGVSLLEIDSNTGVFCEYYEVFKNNIFIEHLWWLLLNAEKVTFKLVAQGGKWKMEKICLIPSSYFFHIFKKDIAFPSKCSVLITLIGKLSFPLALLSIAFNIVYD